jgi:hypothetical protein
MKRITKIVALAAIALFATAAVASATVNVTDGVGHVDKGDVQSALKWNNGDFDKNVGSLVFSAGTVTKVYNNSWGLPGRQVVQPAPHPGANPDA